jgi:ABC-2 type transport system ATP-binding protein
MIEFRNVTRRFGSVEAVKDLSFEVEKGEVVGLLGANGAGKTTAMRLMTGYFPPTEGEVRIGGQRIERNPLGIKRRIGYLPETPPLHDEMIVRNYLRYVGTLKELSGNELDTKIETVLDRLELAEQRDRLVGNLSRGYRQRVALAQALVHEPDILVLDEPTLGLDPKQVRRFRKLIQDLAKDSTLLISSHILPEVREICERVIILKEGEMVAVDKPETLAQEMLHGHSWTLQVDSYDEDWEQDLSDLNGLEDVTQSEENTFQLIFEAADDLLRRRLFDVCCRHDVPVLELSPSEMDLEDIFLELTEESSANRPDEVEADGSS